VTASVGIDHDGRGLLDFGGLNKTCGKGEIL
jgi:hypothetical protein